MNLTPKTRMLRALRHQTVDRIPTQINYTAEMGQKMAAHFSIPAAELPAFLGNHFLRLDISYPVRYSEDKRIRYDWWGVGFDTQEEGYYTAINPLSESKALYSYPWPNPYAENLLDDARTKLEQPGDQLFAAPNFGFALFERAWSLRGLQNFMIDMAIDEGYSEALLDQITDIQLALIHRFLDLDIDGGYFGDDYGAQKGLLFSPKMWRKYIKPRLARLFAPFVERQLPIIMHSDGQIQQILPDLIEIGLTTLNPVQPEVLDHAWLMDRFAGKLSFYGGISTQNLLPHAAPAGVTETIKTCAAALAPEGTGLMLAPSHRMMSDIPMDNVEAMIDVFRNGIT